MSAIKDLYDIIKEFRELVKQYQNAEMSEKLVKVYDCYLEVREEIETLQDENKKLKEEIERLSDISEVEKDLELSPKGYYIKISEKDMRPQPKYCAACWQNYHKLYPVVHTIGAVQQCSYCHTVFR